MEWKISFFLFLKLSPSVFIMNFNDRLFRIFHRFAIFICDVSDSLTVRYQAFTSVYTKIAITTKE